MDALRVFVAGPFVHGFVFVALALFPIVNPLGMAPIFLSYTEGLDESTIDRLARRVAVNSFVLTTASLIIGPFVLMFFGLSLSAVRLAGGLVLAASGWALLHQGQGDSTHRSPEASAEAVMSGAFYPLTLPLTIGPGSIAVMVTLGSGLPGASAGYAVLDGVGAIAGLAVTCLVIYLCYSKAEYILERLGPSGVNVMLRLSAFILLCIGVQIAFEGYMALSHP